VTHWKHVRNGLETRRWQHGAEEVEAMTAFRAIRIQMPDRPGALSAISASLAAHQVDIVHLDVVSHEAGTVVDDLVLSASTVEDIGAAIGGFYPEVIVRTFDEISGDPVLEMGNALCQIAASPTMAAARDVALSGAKRIARADEVVLLGSTESGSLPVLASTTPAPGIEASEAFAGRWVLESGSAAAFPVSDGWAPQHFQHALSASWVALVPGDGSGLVVAIRKLNIPFYAGELERLAAFGAAAGAMAVRFGEPSRSTSRGAAPAVNLPPRSITLRTGLPVT
jgi:hypothetical protein